MEERAIGALCRRNKLMDGSGEPRNFQPLQALYASFGLICCCAAYYFGTLDRQMDDDAKVLS